MTRVRIKDLLRFPRVSLFGGQPVAHGTVLLLPDGESTSRVSGVQDERWRSWNSRQVAVWLTLQGPATLLDDRALFKAMPGCREIHVPFRGVRQAGFDQDAEFDLVAAVPHADDCGADLGATCDVPQRRRHPCLVTNTVPHVVRRHTATFWAEKFPPLAQPINDRDVTLDSNPNLAAPVADILGWPWRIAPTTPGGGHALLLDAPNGNQANVSIHAHRSGQMRWTFTVLDPAGEPLETEQELPVTAEPNTVARAVRGFMSRAYDNYLLTDD